MRIFWKNTVKIVSTSGILPQNPRLPPAGDLGGYYYSFGGTHLR